MERFVLDALFRMGRDSQAIERLIKRFKPMTDSWHSTLWELWDLRGTYNHAWSGCATNILSQYVAGVSPASFGWDTYHVLPQMGPVNELHCKVVTRKGDIVVDIERSAESFSLKLTSPENAAAIVGVPKSKEKQVSQISVNGELIWTKKGFVKTIDGFSFAGEDQSYYRFIAQSGQWDIVAHN